MNYNYGTNTIDVSGGILFASLYNSNKVKSEMSIVDQILDDGDYGNIVDITLEPKRINYNTFRHVFYPTNNKHFQMNVTRNSVTNFDDWAVNTDDGRHKFVFFDFMISSIEHYLGVSRANFNPAIKIHLEKKLAGMFTFRDFNMNGTAYALTWNEISTLLEQVGVLYNSTNDNSALLTMVLNFNTPYVEGLTIRIFFPFVVYDIYRNWHHDKKLNL
tara:strand:+ start:950 stop:1597 length:648 start_codon:yes stop_codon:yes gene_type:complete